MKTENPKIRWHLTPEEKARIRRLTFERVSQAKIARIMNLGAPTVSKAQRAMHLPTRVPIPRTEIMQLFEKGWGGYRIAKHLGVAVSAVYKVAHQNNFRRPDNVGYPTPPGNELRLIEAIQRREDYATHLAKKYKVGICKTQRLARATLACPEFRPGACKPPLSSNFPQKHFDTVAAGPARYVELVDAVARRCFGGRLPALDDEKFVDAMMKAFEPTVTVGLEPTVVSAFAAGLREAVQTLRASQQGPIH
jgi:hypothetical protein